MTEAIELAGLPERLRGGMITADDRRYDDARALYNAMIDRRPAAILPCKTVEDVVAAVGHARDHDALLAIRGGAHNGAGLGSCDGGLVLDLGPMKKIDINPASRTVRVEPGCTQGEVDAATSQHGLAVPAGIVSSTGIAGLTLGGGHGYLTRQHGLTIDNLLSARVVLADGSVVTASETENNDLFWALRGGGGNFGVVVEFTFQSHPVADVYAGPIFFDVADAAAIMRVYRDFIPGAPRELAVFFGMKKVPSTAPFPEELWARPVCAFISCYNGSQKDGEAAMRPLLDACPEPLMMGMGQMPFVDVQGMFDPLMPKGMQWYWKGDFIHELSDAAIDVHVEHGSRTPSELSLMHLYPIDGAVQDRAADETAWGARDARWSMVIAGIDPDPAKADDLRHWARDYWAAIHVHNKHGGSYVNFLGEDDGKERVQASYGPNFDRLRQAKRRYDPRNVFRVNQNIAP